MQNFPTWLDRTYQVLASKRAAMLLLAFIGISLVPGTFAEKDFRLSLLSRVLTGALGLNLVLCTVQRIRTIRRPVLVMHAGVMVIIAGTVMSVLGSIATVNIYEGTATSIAYRWDLGRDADLGYDLSIKKLNLDFYPLPVRVGVLKGDEKVGLFELKTGETFGLDGYFVRADAFDPLTVNLRLTVSRGNEQIGTVDTGGTSALPKGFPYVFKLVAYQDPVLKRAWVDLQISREGRVLAGGTSEVNGPFDWNGSRYHFVRMDRDPYGNPYAGIQIVRAPETPVVYTGFLILLIGSLYWMYGRLTA